MTQDEKTLLKNAKVAYLKFIIHVDKLELDEAKAYLEKNNAELGLCLFLSKLHFDSFEFISDEMERIGRESDYMFGENTPYAAKDKAQLIENLKYRVELINQILESNDTI